MSSNVGGIQGITENDIANYLANTPGFFERHAELLGSIQLTSPHGQRAVSLQERQMEMLRDKIKGLEAKIIEMIRHGQETMIFLDNNRGYVSESAIHDGPYNYFKNWDYAGLIDAWNADDGHGLGLTAATGGELADAP